MFDIEAIKAANRIEEVIGQTHDLTNRAGRYLRGLEHDSLVVDTEKQYFVWNSQGKQGDVITWLELTRGWGFGEAVTWLAGRSGITLHVDREVAAQHAAQRAVVDALTWIMRHLQERLQLDAAATEYCRGRGWPADTVTGAGLGYWDGDRKALAAHCKSGGLDVQADVVQAVMAIPAGMLIYGHWSGGRCEYLSGRSIEGKRHYNPPAALLGERRVYWNHAVNRMVEDCVIVEGQADAVTLGHWGIPAVALAGVSANDQLVKMMERFERVFVALDGDAAGATNAIKLATTLGPTTRMVHWPAIQNGKERIDVKDANEWLQHGADARQARDLLGVAEIFALWMCRRAAAAPALERDAAVDAAVAEVAKLPEYTFEKAKRACADALGIGQRELMNMRRALQKTDSVAAHRMELTMPNGFLDGHLFEMIYQEDENGPRTAFAVRYPDGRLGITRALLTDNYQITPFSPMETVLQAGFVKLCSGLGDYHDDVSLQQEIQAFIHRYVDVPAHIETLASYYIMMTWAFDKFYVLPYLRARGDADSGKSRFTETIGYLCMRPIMITGSTTPSPVFRLMQQWNGLTIVMDEADLPQVETSGDWTMMLNTGYKRESGILRTAISNGEARVEAFSAFGPKILNMRGKFPDDATESRCLTWETSSGRAYRDDIPRYMNREQFKQEALEIRNKLLRWRLQTWADVEPDYNQERTKHLPGRLVEITVSLLSISKDPEFRERILTFVERMNERAVMERQDTMEAKVLLGILRAYYLPDQAILDLPDGLHESLKLQVAHITRQTNRLINEENAAASLQGDDYQPQKETSSAHIGKIISNKLNLETAKATVGTRPKVLVWDPLRINALIVRYGYEDVVMDLAAQAYERENGASGADNIPFDAASQAGA